MQARVDDLLLEIASRQHGLCTRSDLITIGLRSSAIQRRVERRSLAVVQRGIYLVPALAGPLTELALPTLLVRGSALSRRTAAQLHSLALPRSPQIDLAAPLGAHRPTIAAVKIHRTGHLPAVDVADVNGLRVTTAERTLCDLAAVLRPAHFRFVAERAILDGTCTVEDLAACRSAFVRRGRGGSASLNVFVDALLEEDGPDASALEKLLQGVLERFAIRGFIQQFQPPWYDGVRGVVDFAHLEARIILEADSRRWHATTQAMAEDRRRDRLAQQHGWIVLRFTWHELKQRPAAVAAEIRALVTARRQSPAA